MATQNEISAVQNTMTNRPEKRAGFSFRAAGAAVIGNTLIGGGKLALGVFSLSFFTCASALYTFGMVVAKCCALTGMDKSKSESEQYRYYARSGIILMMASLFYIAYSARLFFDPAVGTYHMVAALAIAAFTFAEITINIRGVIVERHNRAPLIHAIKMLSLASSLICLSLTQAAILSFASAEAEAHPAANGMIGLFSGTLAAAMGGVMVVRARKMQRKISADEYLPDEFAGDSVPMQGGKSAIRQQSESAKAPQKRRRGMQSVPARKLAGGISNDSHIGGGGRRKAEPERVHAFE